MSPSNGQELNREHVVAKKLFKREHREPPLILPSHKVCNDGESADDERIIQLVMVLHYGAPSENGRRLELSDGNGPDGEPMALLHGINLQTIIFRWLNGFHAALYGEYLADSGGFIHPPYPAGWEDESGSVAIESVEHVQQ